MADRAQIRSIVAAALAEAGDEDGFGDEESLVVSGRLSSLDVVNILTALEARFGIEIAADDFDPMLFDSVASIATLAKKA